MPISTNTDTMLMTVQFKFIDQNRTVFTSIEMGNVKLYKINKHIKHF